MCAMSWTEYAQKADTFSLADGDDFHKSVLAVAIQQNDLNLLKIILESDGGSDFVDSHGYNLLHYAVQSDQIDVLQFLLDAEVPIDGVTKLWNLTPLLLAIISKKENFALKLIQKGADIHKTDCELRSPLFFAIYGKLPQISAVLIESGADINARDSSGTTPLLAACIQNWLEGVCMLLYYGADPSVPSSTGYLPYHAANSDIKGVLFDFVINDEKFPVDLGTILNAMTTDSPLLLKLFDHVSRIVYETKDLNGFSRKIALLNPYFFELFLQNFEYVVKDLLARCNLFHDFAEHMSSRAIRNLTSLINHQLGPLIVKRYNHHYATNIESISNFIESFLQVCTKTEQIKLLDLLSHLLDNGLIINDLNLCTVYINFGFCPLFKQMLSLDFRRESRRQKELMPVLIFDFDFSIEKFLEDAYNCTSLHQVFGHFCHQKFNRFCQQFVKFKIENKVALLVELARNAARKHLIDFYGVKNYKRFVEVLENLEITENCRKILTYEMKLYWIGPNTTVLK